jgi:hypothetical protein
MADDPIPGGETMDKYRIIEPDQALEQNILTVFSHNGGGAIPLAKIIEELDQQDPPPRDVDVRQALWGLINRHEIGLDKDRCLYSINGHSGNGQK